MTKANIPQTASAFKAWADNECGKWPQKLQMQAYNTFCDLTYGPALSLELIQFTEHYRKWEAEQP